MLSDGFFFHSKFIAISLNEHGVINEISPAAEQVLGRSNKMAVGHILWDLIENDVDIERALSQKDNLSIFDHYLKTVLLGPIRGDVHIQNREGSTLIWIYPSGKTVQRERSDQARNAAKLASGMAAMLAHEIRNPLGSIRGAAQLLDDGLSQEDGELVQVIEEETKRIGRLVAEFEDMAGSTPPHITKVNIHEVLDQVKRSAKAGYARKISIEENYDPSLPEIACDRDRMVQALHNVLKNAVDALEFYYETQITKAKITIQTRFRTGHRRINGALPVEISLRDNGGGIAKNIREDVFKPFVTSKSQGTGLGLSVVARMIEEIGGVIEMDTSSDGTEIRFFVPIYTEIRE